MNDMSGWRNLLKVGNATVLLLLVGCSSQISSVNDTLKEAFWGIDDVTLSAEQVNELPYASTYVRLNNGPRVFMVLAFAEKNPVTGNAQLKWVSNDHAMIVTEQGRIVKTLNLPEQNLAAINGEMPEWTYPGRWQATYDWQTRNQYGYSADVSTIKLNSDFTQPELWQEALEHWQETISFSDLSSSIQNHYWVNQQGVVLKSIQHIGPNMAQIEMDILKPYLETRQ